MLTNGIKKDTRVLIIGAGIGGLALAQALRKQQIPYLVFERDAGVHARGQGWAIALHAYGSFLDDVEYSNISRSILGDLLQSTPNDLPPLQETAVTHGLGRGASYTSRAAFFDAYSGEKKMEIGGDLGDPKFFIRVTRSKLREWLRSHIDIQWNKCFVRYEESDHGVTAFFADGSSATGEMLVGCEGINSHVRTQLFAPNPPQLNRICTGAIIGNATLSKAEYEAQLENARSLYFITGRGFRMLIGLVYVAEGKETARYYWIINWLDPEAGSPDFWALKAPPAERLAFVLKMIEGIDERFASVIKATKVEDMAAPLALKDLVPIETPRGRVSLLGDAAHPMTPFRGEGANNAIQDGLNLAKVINAEIAMTEGLTGEKCDVPSLLKTYEEEMRERNTKSVLGSREAALDGSGDLSMNALSSWKSEKQA
ncbi:hypothetical protein MMC34_002022 [Xylographa carneopallida]|nr:hypothetical protein [Xylographa carneopallida]